MNMHNNIPNVLWEHLEKFEINLMNMKYLKTHSTNASCYLNDFHLST
jgi:hypothetical protein